MVILRGAVSTQFLRVTNRQTDGQTSCDSVVRAMHTAYRQNGDKLKWRQVKTATPKRRPTKMATWRPEVNQNGDSR